MLVRCLTIGVATVIVVMPFHATLSVWVASWAGHYVGIRLWKEWLLLVLVALALAVAWRDTKLRSRITQSVLARLIALYVAVNVVWGVAAHALQHVTWPALAYGWISDTRYFIFFLVVWVVAAKSSWLHTHWTKLIFAPAVVVIIIGLLQYFVLPYDFLRHIGYSTATIFPYEDINHNIQYLRVMSTLRGANPLGAYLSVVLVLVVAIAAKQKRQTGFYIGKRAVTAAALVVGGITTLVLTFSRSAWIGAACGVAATLWANLRSNRARAILLAVAVVAVLGSGGVIFGLRNDTTFQNVFFHTQTHSLVATTSNEGHLAALRRGVLDVLHQPFGLGPGTAGPASVYNTGHAVRIAENYFIQIAQETGLVGLALFLAAQVVLAWELWLRRDDALALGLFGSLIAVSIIGLLSHVWADDTLAYIWWGLAAVAVGTVPQSKRHQRKSRASGPVDGASAKL